MKTATKLLLGFAAALSMVLFACSKDEPTSPEEPNQPENPTDLDTQENPEQWGNERPHGFYFDINKVEFVLNDEGFLRFGNRGASSVYRDYVVIEKESESPSKNNRAKYGVINAPFASSPISIKGKRATPWNNVEQYVEMFSTVGIRPDSKFSADFRELIGLPVGDVKSLGFFVWDHITRMDVISKNYFNKDIPAGASMRGTTGQLENPVGIAIMTISGNWAFNRIKTGQPVIGGPGPYTFLGLREYPERDYLCSDSEIWMLGYPEKAGDYPMTFIMELESGTVLKQDFKIRFVNEE